MIQATALCGRRPDAEATKREPSGLRPARPAPVWPLTGRDGDLQALAEMVDPVGGSPGVVLAGAPGVGKTRLAREAVGIAERRGATTRWVAATSSASSIPLGALSHLLPPCRSGADAEGLQPVRQAIETIRDLAGGRSVVLGVDDAHLLDDTSATLVHQVALSGVATLVLTMRSGARAPDPVMALWKDQLLPRIEVAPLGRADVAELVSTVLRGPLDGAAAARFWRLTLGNPLLLREVVLGALDADQLVERSGLWRWQGDFSPTSRLTELVRDRLGRLPPDQRALVEAVAFGEPLGARLATDLSSDEALRRAEEGGVVTLERNGRRWEVRMAHPLYGEVVKAECPSSRARNTLRALVAVQAAGGLRRRGDILRQATLQLDAEGIADVELLVAAAGQANIVDPKVAERMARAALSSGGGFPAQLALAMALRCQGQAHQARVAAERAASMASTDGQRVDSAAVLAQILFWDLGAAAQAEAVLEGAAAASSVMAVADGVTALRASFALFTGRPREAMKLVVPIISSESSSARAVVHASAVCSHALARCGRTAEALAANDRGRAVMESHNDSGVHQSVVAYADFTAVLVHAELTARRLAGPLHPAEEQASVVHDRWAALPGGARMPIARLLCGQVALACGRPVTAARHLEAAVAELAPKNGGSWLYWSLISLTEALALTGDTAAAQMTLSRAVAEHRHSLRLWEPDLLLAEAWVLGTAGELTRAVARAQQAVSSAAAMGQSAIEAVALHTCVRLGHREPAVADRLGDLAREVGSPLVAAASVHAAALVAMDGAGLDRAAAGFAAATTLSASGWSSAVDGSSK